jgi:hypothetical protein
VSIGTLQFIHTRGRGQFPDPLQPQQLQHNGLLNQLEHKLAAYGTSLSVDDWVRVLLDLDNDNCVALLLELKRRLDALPGKQPNVLFRLAIEETESWFIADFDALAEAFPERRLSKLKQMKIAPDAIVRDQSVDLKTNLRATEPKLSGLAQSSNPLANCHTNPA